MSFAEPVIGRALARPVGSTRWLDPSYEAR